MMDGANRPVVTYEPVEIQNLGFYTNQTRRKQRNIPEVHKKKPKHHDYV